MDKKLNWQVPKVRLLKLEGWKGIGKCIYGSTAAEFSCGFGGDALSCDTGLADAVKCWNGSDTMYCATGEGAI